MDVEVRVQADVVAAKGVFVHEVGVAGKKMFGLGQVNIIVRQPPIAVMTAASDVRMPGIVSQNGFSCFSAFLPFALLTRFSPFMF